MIARGPIAGLSAITFLLTSCASVGPDYEKPKVFETIKSNPMPFGEADKSLYSEDESTIVWWKLFDDANINASIDEALKANTDLRVALANLERARGAISEVQGARLPTTNISASATRGVSPAAGSPASDKVPAASYPTMNTFDTGISASWDLDLFGRLRRTLEASRAEADAVESLYRLTKMTVVANTVRAFTDACSIGRQISVAKRTIKSQEESTSLVTRNVRAGRGTPLDLSRSNALLAQLKAALPPLEAQKKLALFRLATLTGKPPQEFPKTAAECESFPKFTSKIPVGNGAKLIARRPDIRVAERRLAAATASIGVATASLYPNISFGASAGLTAHETDILGKDPSERFSLGPLISWSFPNIVGARARINQSKASTKAALANFDGVILNALREVESALVSYKAELDRNSELTTAREESVKSLELSRRILKAGAGNYLDVLDVERSLATADSALAASDAAVVANRVALFLALGSGWEDE